MKHRFFALAGTAIVLASAVGLEGQMAPAHPSVEMNGVKAAMKLQTPVEGFMTVFNGKVDLRATEVVFEPDGAVKDHYHFGPGIRRVLEGELTLIYADTKKEQVVHTGEYFYEPGDANIWALNRGKEPAKLLIVELVPAGVKGSRTRRSGCPTEGNRLLK